MADEHRPRLFHERTQLEPRRFDHVSDPPHRAGAPGSTFGTRRDGLLRGSLLVRGEGLSTGFGTPTGNKAYIEGGGSPGGSYVVSMFRARAAATGSGASDGRSRRCELALSSSAPTPALPR